MATWGDGHGSSGGHESDRWSRGGGTSKTSCASYRGADMAANCWSRRFVAGPQRMAIHCTHCTVVCRLISLLPACIVPTMPAAAVCAGWPMIGVVARSASVHAAVLDAVEGLHDSLPERHRRRVFAHPHCPPVSPVCQSRPSRQPLRTLALCARPGPKQLRA